MDLHALSDACFELAPDLISLIAGKKEATWLAELLWSNQQDRRKEAYCVPLGTPSQSRKVGELSRPCGAEPKPQQQGNPLNGGGWTIGLSQG